MNEHDFQRKLGDLLEQISELPEPERSQVQKLADETRTRHDRMRKTIGDLQESLDYLRLSIKYLVFDLEATRRENQYLRKLLDRQAGQGEDEGRHEAE
ncbi:MAG: transcriptional regulator [Phycisphaerales bacterium]